MRIYKSKIDWYFFLPFLFPIFLLVKGIIDGNYFTVTVMAAGLFLIGYLFKKTEYIVSGNKLKIKCFFIVNANIDINGIRKIEKTRSLLSSPALSMDRIIIYYNKFDDITISPKEKQAFVDDLLKINPNIDVKL